MGVTYFRYSPLKEDGKLDCYLGTPNHLLTAYNEEVFRYLDKKFGQKWRKEVPTGIFGLDQSLNELHDYNWLIKTLSRECKYPVAQQRRNKGLCFTGGIYCDPGRLYQPCYGTQPSTPCIPKSR